MTEPHVHEAWAERDADGQWEPDCSGCWIFATPAISAVMRRWPTFEQAQAAAAAVLAMLDNTENQEGNHARGLPD